MCATVIYCVFPWNFCNSHTLQAKGITKWPNGKFRQNLPRAADLNSYCYLVFLEQEQKVKAILEKCLGRIRLWYNATYFHGNALGTCKVGSSLQTATAYRTDMPFFYLKIVWGTSVLRATSEAGTWQTRLTSQNRGGTRSVVSVDFLLWTGLNTDAERAWLELSCLWTHLSLAPDFRKMGVRKMRWLCVMWNLVWKKVTPGASLKPGWSLGTNNPRARVFQLALICTVWDCLQETQWEVHSTLP